MTEPFPTRSVRDAGPAVREPDHHPEPTAPRTAATPPPAQRSAREPARRGLQRRWRRLPPALRLLLVLHTLLLLVYTVLSPNYRGPDEPLHIDLVAATLTGQAIPWPAPGTHKVSQGVSAGGFITNGRIPERRVFDADAVPPRGERPSYRDRGGGTPTRFPNQLVQHPPLFYYLSAPVLAVVPGWQDVPLDRLVGLLRLLNVLMVAPLPLLYFLLARKVGLPEPVGVAAAAFPLAVPQLYRIGGSVNNDNLLLPLLAGAALAVAAVARGDLRYRTAAALGMVAGLALLTKGLALYLPLLIGLGYLVGAARAGLRRAVLPGTLAMGLAFAIGGWWWVRNRLEYGTFQPDGTKLVQASMVPHTTLGDTGWVWAKQFVKLVNQRFWLEPGFMNLPGVIWVAVAIAAVLTLVGVLLSVATRTPSWPDALLLALPMMCLTGIVGFGSWEVWEKVIRPAGMQGRYLFGALPGVAVLAVAGAGRLLGRRRTALPLVVLVLAGAMQALSAYYTSRTYWLPETGSVPSRLAGALDGLLSWSPFPPAAVVLVLVGTLGAAFATVVVLVQDVLRGAPEAAPAPTPAPA